MSFPHNLPFDPTYGYDRDALMNITPPDDEPEDFTAFWEDTFAQALAVPPRPTHTPIDSLTEGYDYFEIDLDAWGDRHIGGWYMRPRDIEPQLLVVIGHGYAGRDAPAPVPAFGVPAACLMICKRGFHRSAFPDLPDTADRHVVHGIESRDTYMHRGCTADVWAARQRLLELHPDLRDHLVYWGSSFGGGIGAMAVAWDKRIAAAFLDVPSFGHHAVRLTLPCVGSGEAVRRYFQDHPEAADVLRYYDSAIHAAHITCPTMVAAACFDPAVPPPGQFAVYHGLRGPRELYVRHYAHFELPEPIPGNYPDDAGAKWLGGFART